MANFMSYRTVAWNPDIDCSELLAEHAKYQTIPAIGGVQHMCQDMEMGLKLGWGGILEKINHYRANQSRESKTSMPAWSTSFWGFRTGFAVTPRLRAAWPPSTRRCGRICSKLPR